MNIEEIEIIAEMLGNLGANAEGGFKYYLITKLFISILNTIIPLFFGTLAYKLGKYWIKSSYIDGCFFKKLQKIGDIMNHNVPTDLDPREQTACLTELVNKVQLMSNRKNTH